MKNQGLIDITIREIKNNDDLANKIIKKRGWNKNPDKIKFVYDSLQYNVFTIGQFADLLGIESSSLITKMKPGIQKGSLHFPLDCTYPFKRSDGVGPKFIVRNEKSEKMLIS